MPLATIHLISLTKETTTVSFLEALRRSNLHPLVISIVIRWIIRPEKIDVSQLLHPPAPYELLLILPVQNNDMAETLPPALSSQIAHHWSITAGIPSRLTQDFTMKTNPQILHPDAHSVPALTGALERPLLGKTAQTLELSPELAQWIQSFAKTRAGKSPLSMLNLLAFKDGMKPSYLQYGKAFAESIGSRRGGNAKLVGNIVKQSPADVSGGVWHEFALASYPSILHFGDMLASEDYQAVNLKYRVPALEDTCILCTSEIEVEELLADSQIAEKKKAMEKL